MDASWKIEQIEVVKAKAVKSRDFWLAKLSSDEVPGCARKQLAAAVVKIQECEEAIAQVQTLEAIRIRYLIVRAGGMATKTAVEDVLIMRRTVPDRSTGHQIMNDIEYHRLDVMPGRPWPEQRYGAEPDPADYPEICKVDSIRFYRRQEPPC